MNTSASFLKDLDEFGKNHLCFVSLGDSLRLEYSLFEMDRMH